MYRLGRYNKKTPHYKWLGIVVAVLLVVGAGAFVIFNFLNGGDSHSTGEVAITREYVKEVPNNHKTFDLKEFTVLLPDDWVLKEHMANNQINSYSWQASKKGADNRWFTVYVDRLPTKQVYNRMLPITIKDNKIIGTGSISDNCTAFTGTQGANKPAQPGIDTLPTKWQDVSFLCDMANYTRNVVGAGTEDNGTQLSLSGPKTGAHVFVVVYTDHNINPDYQILEDALTSLTVK
jgi:hypothetical protein